MRNPIKYSALLTAAALLLATALVACAGGGAGPSAGAANALTFSTPDASQATPTPNFPPFTVGAWVSNYSPGTSDNITIYVICRVQDPTMQTPSKPPPQHLTVTVILSGPINDTLTGTTGDDGIAAIPYAVNDPYAGQPVQIDVNVFWQNQTYRARSFFTASPGTAPTATGNPNASPSPSH